AEDAAAARSAQALRSVIPEDRRRVFDPMDVITLICDEDVPDSDRRSPLELRAGFAPGVRTVLARIGGVAVGVVANDSRFLAGAIDADAADKVARFMQLCDAFDLPI